MSDLKFNMQEVYDMPELTGMALVGYNLQSYNPYANIPQELKDNCKWAVAYMTKGSDGKPDKVPRNTLKGYNALVNKPETWMSYEQAVKSATENQSGIAAIGFLLEKDNPYIVIDIDAPKESDREFMTPDFIQASRDLLDVFSTYTEKSSSGNGMHIILKKGEKYGAPGLRRLNVEVYSQDRYIICTGNTTNPAPILDRSTQTPAQQAAANAVLKKLNLGETRKGDNPDVLPILTDHEQLISDDEVKRKMFTGMNGASLLTLYDTRPSIKKGDESSDTNWSVLDSSLCASICFHTKNHDQAVRIFEGSKLWRGKGSDIKKGGYENDFKYVNDYLLRRTMAFTWDENAKREAAKKAETEQSVMVEHIRQLDAVKKLKATSSVKNTTMPIYTHTITMGVYNDPKKRKRVQVDQIANWKGYEVVRTPSGDRNPIIRKMPPIPVPPGLVGELALYIYNSAYKPIWEVAVMGALGLMSGMTGRHFNVSESGLNLYMMLIGKTGIGKEAYKSAIGKTVSSVTEMGDGYITNFIGPTSIASGSAMINYMSQAGSNENDIASKVFIFSELGQELGIMMSPNANDNVKGVRKQILDLYNANEWGKHTGIGIYANKENNIKSIEAPCVVIIGEGTPADVDRIFIPANIESGFIPRFIFLEYDGDDVPTNNNKVSYPNSDLCERVSSLVKEVASMRVCELDGKRDGYVRKVIISPEALSELDGYEEWYLKQSSNGRTPKELWNRGRQNAQRIAALVAIGVDSGSPTITKEMIDWGLGLVHRSVKSVSTRMIANDTNNEDRLSTLMMNVVKNYFKQEVKLNDAGEPKDELEKMRQNGMIPFHYIHSRLHEQVDYKREKLGDNGKGGLKMIAIISSVAQGLIKMGFLVQMNDKTGNQLRNHDVFGPGVSFDRDFNSIQTYQPDFEEEPQDQQEEGMD